MGTRTTSRRRRAQHKRLWKWTERTLIGFALLVAAIFVWFLASPWPGSMIIRHIFDKDSAQTKEALEKHAPSGIATLGNQAYIPGDNDANIDVYMPESARDSGEKLPVVIWTHGGAWISGDKTDAAIYFRLIAKEGYTVIATNYSLAPEKTYPTPAHQLNAMYAYVLDNAERFRADTNQIFLAGDSAGSQLSAQMAALATNPSYAREVGVAPSLKPEQLKGVVLACGIYKMKELAHPHQTVSRLIGWGDDVVVWAYSGTHDFSDPVIKQMSPYYHVTKDFPPTFITGGNEDPLTDVQSKPFANELERLGVRVTRLFYPKDHQPPLPHEYQFNLDNADGQKALDQIVDFLRGNTDPGI